MSPRPRARRPEPSATLHADHVFGGRRGVNRLGPDLSPAYSHAVDTTGVRALYIRTPGETVAVSPY